MNFRKKVAWLVIVAAIQMPCVSFAAEEDKELSLIAAEQERSEDDERLDEINPALTETITTERTQETDKDKRERKKKLKQARKEKEKANEQKLKDSTNKKTNKRRDDSPIEIAPTEPTPQPVVETKPEPQPVVETKPEPQPVVETKPEPRPVVETKPEPRPVVETKPIPQPVVERQSSPPPAPKSPLTPPSSPAETVPFANQKMIYANFAEVARAVHFIPLYMPRKSGYEITALYAGQGIVEIRYSRRWEPTVSLTVRTYKRTDGEEPQDISGVTGVKWRVDTTTGTTIYVAKISETEQVAAWAVGHYTFSARAENLSYAGFYSLVADELVELSTHYYLDI
ncbi:MAG: hypothetical protein IJG33_05230 [Selenomonadaceae bacterium]|nr:hypothetical protein [Selenomonadaceae bacterium]